MEQKDIDKIVARQMRSLSRSSKSVAEIRKRLAEAGVDEEDQNTVIETLIKYSFLDDQRFAEEFVRLKSSQGFGIFRIRRQLQERGVNEETVEIAITNENLEEHQKELLERAVNKRLTNHGEPTTQKELKRLLDFCNRRGFDGELVRDQLQPFFDKIFGD
jgi:regulatory protein